MPLEEAGENSLPLNKVIHTVTGLVLLANTVNLAIGCHTVLTFQRDLKAEKQHSVWVVCASYGVKFML